MKNGDVIPNYYSYILKTNGRGLSGEQRCHFSNCINKIYHNNDKFMCKPPIKYPLSLYL